jgi:hypothetical protein
MKEHEGNKREKGKQNKENMENERSTIITW